MKNIKEQINEISVIGRQCVAVICLERFCRKYKLEHPEIWRFIEHVWRVCQVTPETFVDWDEGFCELAITGQERPYPADLSRAIPGEIASDFDAMTRHVFETSAITWYGSDLKGTRKQLNKVFEIARRHGVELPDISTYKNPPVEHRGGWGPPLTNEQVRRWRSTA